MKKPLLLIITAAGVFLHSGLLRAQETPITSPDNPLVLNMQVDAVPESEKPDWMQYKDTYAGEQNDLQNPNRTNDEVLTWVQEVATEALTFDSSSIDKKLAAQKSAFVAQGWQQYEQYLAETKLADLVRGQNYAVTTIIDGNPNMLNNAAAGGNYHWLVEAPLLMTFTKFDPATGQSKPAGGGRFKLTMQLGRTPATAGKDGMAVESWKIQQKQ